MNNSALYRINQSVIIVVAFFAPAEFTQDSGMVTADNNIRDLKTYKK